MGRMEHLKSLVLDGNPLKSLRRDVVMVRMAFLLQYVVPEKSGPTQSLRIIGNSVEKGLSKAKMFKGNLLERLGWWEGKLKKPSMGYFVEHHNNVI